MSNAAQNRKTWDSTQNQNTTATAVSDDILPSADNLMSLNAPEGDIITAMISQSTHEYDPSK